MIWIRGESRNCVYTRSEFKRSSCWICTLDCRNLVTIWHQGTTRDHNFGTRSPAFSCLLRKVNLVVVHVNLVVVHVIVRAVSTAITTFKFDIINHEGGSIWTTKNNSSNHSSIYPVLRRIKNHREVTPSIFVPFHAMVIVGTPVMNTIRLCSLIEKKRACMYTANCWITFDAIIGLRIKKSEINLEPPRLSRIRETFGCEYLIGSLVPVFTRKHLDSSVTRSEIILPNPIIDISTPKFPWSDIEVFKISIFVTISRTSRVW
mmetsp:Transcript_15061/g.16284  ORF Transcript_15061/g.16284 Transcript_15061/m.16284 type:complete len:261 (+) Transcript_15061:130-912(+)